MTSAALRKILDQDIPALPAHWHDYECDCEPTVAYIRVSRVGKRTRITSPTVQLNEIIADAKRNKRRIVKVLVDINKSGQDFDREAFGEVLEDVRAGVYKHVSVWKWSRFGRTTHGSLSMLKTLEDIDGVVDSATEPYDHDNVFGEFSRDHMLSFASLQSRMMGETWKSVHETLLDRKLPHSGAKRFGYDYRDEDERNKHFEINEEEAAFLREAYRLYVAGASMNGLATKANARGFRTQHGNPWTHPAWSKMMDSGFAAGLMRSRSKAMKKALKRKRRETRDTYDVWTEGAHEPIIDKRTWEAYTRIRDEGAKLPARLVRGSHELSGLLFCDLCGRRLTANKSARQFRWRCLRGAAYHPGRPVSITNEHVLQIVRAWLTEKSQPEWIEREMQRRFDQARGARPEADRLETEIRKAEAQAGKVLNLYVEIDDDSDETKTRVLAQINALEEKIKELKAERASLTVGAKLPDWEALGSIIQGWEKFEPAAHNAALRCLLGMVVVPSRSAPRVWRDLADRVRVVPLWEMDDWEAWLSARRQRSV